MKRLLFLLMAVLTVGVMAGIVNAQTEVSQDFGVANFAADTSFNSTAVGIHTGTGPTDLGFVASGLCSSGGDPPAHHGVTNNRYEFMHFSSNSGVIQTEAADPTYGVDFGNPRTGYILFDSVELGGGSSLSMSVGEITGATNTGDDEVVIRVYVNGEPGLGKDIFDTRADGNGELDSGDARGGAIYVEDTVDDMGGILTYDFAHSDTSVILYVAIFTDDDGDGYYIDDIVISSAGTAQLVSPIVWALVDVGLLEWLRPDPIVGTDPYVTVNVRFGTDPNLIVGVNGTVEIETDYNGDSSTNIPATLDIDEDYYWIVDVIDPNGGNGGHFVPGDLWTFVTTTPPEIVLVETGPAGQESTDVSEQDRDVNFDTYTISLSTNPTSAVTIDIFENLPSTIVIPIATGNDDAEEHLNEGGGNIDLSSSDLELGYEQNVPDPQLVGLLFRNVPVNGAGAISSAYVEFEADQTDTGELHLLVAAEKNAFPDNISGTDKDLSRRVQTDTKIVWDVEDWTTQHDKYNTPDITTVIEEIVSDPDWRSGGDIMILVSLDPAFLVNGLPTGQVNREAEASSPYPVLYINWAAPSQLEIIPSQVILTAGEAPETITVKAIDDSFLESDPHFASIGYTITTSDTDYSALTPVDIDVSILENECGAWGFLFGDLTNDCVVGLADLAEFASQFGLCTDPHFPAICDDVQ